VKINKNYDNEKIFKIIVVHTYTYYGNTSFLYFTSKPYLKGKRNPAELLTDKIQEAINQSMGFYYSGFIYFYGKPIYCKKKGLVNAENKLTNITIKTIKLTTKIKTANDYFNNDSTTFKLRDPGTSSSIVMQDEKQWLLIHGSTWDSYVWILDENYVPSAWRMWVSIVPRR
jgi:hypothetical protein